MMPNLDTTANLNVNKDFAELCLQIVNIYLNRNSDVDMIVENLTTGEVEMRFIDRKERCEKW